MPFTARIFQNIYDMGRHNISGSPLRQFVKKSDRHSHLSLRSPIDQDFPVIPVFPDHEWHASDWTYLESQCTRAISAGPYPVDSHGHFLDVGFLCRKGKKS